MRKVDLKTSGLSLKNLSAKPVRTACLMVVVAILALNLRQGLNTMTKRFGADLIGFVPQGQSLLANFTVLEKPQV